jgi:hypothetical protein
MWMTTDAISQYYIEFLAKDGKEGREDIPALDDYEAAKTFWAIVETGKYKELNLYKTTPMLVWFAMGKGEMIQS